MDTFHRKPLPPSCIAFASKEGRGRFASAIAQSTADPYFALGEQFRTQEEPAYCGLSTLVMVMNAMAIDPGRVWKGVWRWFHEEMLNCCKPLADVKREGVGLAEFCCLARCNGAEAAQFAGAEVSLEQFRARVVECSRDQQAGFLCLNYNRAVLDQTGTGHFSPVAAYDEASDSALVLDVARFKYPPHWVSVELLHEAVGAHRGFAVLKPGVVKGEGGSPAVGCEHCMLEGFHADGRALPAATATAAAIATAGENCCKLASTATEATAVPEPVAAVGAGGGLTVRAGVLADAAAILALTLQLARETEDGLELNAEMVSAGVERGLTPARTDEQKPRYWVVEADSAVCGFVAISPEWSDWWDCEYWWVTSLFVSAERRRGGGGTQLFAAMLTAAAGHKVQTVNLRVERENAAAQKFYARQGFLEDPVHLVYSFGLRPDGSAIGVGDKKACC